MIGFEYPASPHVRRHGPGGYKDYGSYRDWLRDEFTFHCVYCLHREQWYSRNGTFHLDHFVPVSIDPDGKCEYTNLLYACATCNEAKRDIIGLADPCKMAFHQCLRITAEGRVQALNQHGEKLKQVLLLDSESNVRCRSRMMRILDVLQKSDAALHQECMSFPEDLPDLRTKRVPENNKPDGAVNCYFALRENGKLPATY
jgi:HNH endonuclease